MDKDRHSMGMGQLTDLMNKNDLVLSGRPVVPYLDNINPSFQGLLYCRQHQLQSFYRIDHQVQSSFYGAYLVVHMLFPSIF